MNDAEALRISMEIMELRSNAEYQRAARLVRRLNPEAINNACPNSDVYAALRLLIGTWQQIAVTVLSLNQAQRNQFFKSHPVSLMWQALAPAIEASRSRLHQNFAAEFEKLHNEYQQWLRTPEGDQFRSPEQQATTALFA